MMFRRAFVTAIAFALASFAPPGTAFADESGQPTAAEKPFVDAVAADLSARFPTPDSARKAGYFRYTDEDETGAISYANKHWTSVDQKHPSQLWYDVKGRLLGADFSVPYTDAKPTLFGLGSGRWEKFSAHVHYGLVGPSGTVYGETGAKKLATVGASLDSPSAAALVKLGIAKKASDVRFVFTFPAIWDVSVWVLPNPDGAFAEKNPDVKPANAKPMAM